MDHPINIRWTTPEEKLTMFGYSHSIVESILTCPVYGLIRYVKRRYYPTNRVLPLEAGSAMHDVFAAVRLWQMYRLQDLPDHFKFHGARCLNKNENDGRFESCWKPIRDSERDELLSFCFKVLNTAGYYDDPDDRMRTIANMEETTIRYVDEMLPRMRDNIIWIKDRQDATAPIGIEQTFDIVIETGPHKLRYIGTIDGIVEQIKYPGTVMVDENKTASRLDTAWRESYSVKSQPTGYIAVARLHTGLRCSKVRMIGTKIKQSRSAEDFLAFIEEREDFQMQDWVKSIVFCDQIVKQHGDEPLLAPQFTHSCNRYFRACSFIQLCGATPADREDIYNNSMVEAPLTPSQKALLGNA